MKQQIILFEDKKRMFLAKNEFLKKVSSSVQKEYNDLLASNDVLKQKLETKFNLLQHNKSLEKTIEIIKKEMRDTVNCFDAEKKVFENEIFKLEKVLEQRVKDFDELASQNYTSLQKENNDLITSYNELKKKYDTDCEKLKKEKDELKMHYKRLFDSIKQKKAASQVFTKSIPKVNVLEKIYTDTKANKEYYAVASGGEPPKAKTKYKKKADEPVTSSKTKTVPASKGLAVLSEVALSEAEEIKLATKRNDLTHPNLSTYKAYDEEKEEEKAYDDEVSYDNRVYTPPDHQLTDEEENQEGNMREVEMIKTRMKTPLLDQTEGKSAHAEEHGQKVNDLEDQSHQEFNTGNDDETSVQEALDVIESQWNLSSFPTLDCEWHKTKTIDNRPPQPWITQMAQAASTQSSFNEFLATPIDFSAFIMNWLKIDNLTQEILTGQTYDLIKGTCKSTKAADYGQVKWIKDKFSRIWNPEKVVYDKHAYRGTYHWGLKRHRFYGYASNMESSYDVYFRHMIIALTRLNIMEWFGYTHLEEIIVRRQDDKLYKFREGNFKRLQRQDIKDMLLLLVQDKLPNLNLEERYALNVALRMFTRRIVIQERVEDLQLGVKSYKKINLKRTDTYHSDLRRMTPYTAYPDIQGIIYKDEMNRNRLMRTDELYKFSDGTLNHVHTALNDIAIGIEMDYLPK
nr:hypothetical protein [Tanacetum cinerariifolium]